MAARKAATTQEPAREASPRVPRGRVKAWTAAELERRARVTDSDLALAASAFRRHAAPAFRTLLDAQEREGRGSA